MVERVLRWSSVGPATLLPLPLGLGSSLVPAHLSPARRVFGLSLDSALNHSQLNSTQFPPRPLSAQTTCRVWSWAGVGTPARPHAGHGPLQVAWSGLPELHLTHSSSQSLATGIGHGVSTASTCPVMCRPGPHVENSRGGGRETRAELCSVPSLVCWGRLVTAGPGRQHPLWVSLIPHLSAKPPHRGIPDSGAGAGCLGDLRAQIELILIYEPTWGSLLL